MNFHPGTHTFVTLPVATPVTVARGDGIGPEIMDAALRVLEACGAKLAIEEIEIGEKVYAKGLSAGIAPEAWASLRRTGLFFKAPITTPQGGGFKSLNVTIRKGLGLFANVRPTQAYAPFVATKHPAMDVVIVRENEEDLYAGIEHRQTDEVYQCLKLISRPGTERIVRYAFDYARASGRRSVTCFTKDNIMKLTDGLFHKVFDEIGAEYPEIEKRHMIIDIGAARLANSPEGFDVIVTPNLYGDIVSDIAAEVAGSVGLAGSANIGAHGAMFEAIHGSAPDIAGQGIANPSGLILAGTMMLQHVGQSEAAQRLHNAWLVTIEDGVHTADIYTPATSSERVGTQAFADAVIARLGESPKRLKPVHYDTTQGAIPIPAYERKAPACKDLVGMDVFVEWRGTADDLAERIKAAEDGLVALKLITNRGVKVWPQGLPETFCTDHWRCRFEAHPGKVPNKATLARLLGRLALAGVEFVKTEHLFTFDGVPGYSLGQGQ
jgi:isocitrate dehydrogenase